MTLSKQTYSNKQGRSGNIICQSEAIIVTDGMGLSKESQYELFSADKRT